MLQSYGPAPKEHTKEKSDKKNKKKQVDKNEPQKYSLTIFKDGTWQPATPEELKELIGVNKEIEKYLRNPELVNELHGPDVPSNVTIYDHWDKAAKRIMTHLWREQGAWNFHEPVNAEAMNLLDYHQIISNPMDFGTIKQKLSNGSYRKCKEFIDDVELVFSNCVRYNGETSEFGVLSRRLDAEFKKQCQILFMDYYM